MSLFGPSCDEHLKPQLLEVELAIVIVLFSVSAIRDFYNLITNSNNNTSTSTNTNTININGNKDTKVTKQIEQVPTEVSPRPAYNSRYYRH